MYPIEIIALFAIHLLDRFLFFIKERFDNFVVFQLAIKYKAVTIWGFLLIKIYKNPLFNYIFLFVFVFVLFVHKDK